MKSIFINISSYRDPQLLPTIKDAILRAKYPDRIYFGVMLQGHLVDINDFLRDSRLLKNIHVKYCPIKDVRGTGWSRNIINRDMFDGQDYWLQTDSHTRFIEDWDEEIIEAFEEIPGKHLFTGFPPHFGLDEKYEEYIKRPVNSCLYIKDVTKQWTFKSTRANVWLKGQKYKETISVSGAFQFSDGNLPKHLSFDKYLDPWRDQEIVSLLSYMAGYTLYVPRKPFLFHCYQDNTKPSDKKFRPLITEDFSETSAKGYEKDCMQALAARASVRTLQDWKDRVKHDIAIVEKLDASKKQ